MIVLSKRSWIRMVFAGRGSVLFTIWPRILVVTCFAILVTYVHQIYGIHADLKSTTPFSLVGLAMAIFLGFRNNESYERFWEGRKLWGRMVNVSRSFARQSLSLIIPGDDSENLEVTKLQHQFIRATIAYVHAFRHHLRDTSPEQEVTQYLDDGEQQRALSQWNVPNAILQIQGMRIRKAWKAGYLHEYHVAILEESLTEMMSVQGGCERIKSTPLPFTYNVLIHRIVAVYCLAMPFGLVESMGWVTPIAVALISYAFFGLDAIGDEVEQPFERDDNDLPLEGISRTIEINLLEMMGADGVPEPMQPDRGVLL